MHRVLKNLLAFGRPPKKVLPFSVLFKKFQSILERNNRILELMADMGDKLGGEYVFDRHYIEEITEKLGDLIFKMISDLSILNQRKNTQLFLACEHIQHAIHEELAGRHVLTAGTFVIPFSELGHELTEQAGTKMANIGDIRNRLGLSTLDGFVITSKAFQEFMQQNELLDKAELAMKYWDAKDNDALKHLADEMQKSILAAPLPRKLTSEILAEFDLLAKRSNLRNITVALRSSASGEDGASSFAGQYETALNVTRDQLIDGYRRVVASTYTFKAWHYRLYRGYHEHETAMAVGCQLMAEGLVSGVLHTYAPHLADGVMIANAVWGLCSPVVRGEKATDTLVFDRTPPYTLRSLSVADKTQRLVIAPGGGTKWEDTPAELHEAPSLSQEQMRKLAQAAMSLERYYKRPLEIEWTYDLTGTLQILQARPLRYWSAPSPTEEKIDDATRNAVIVFSGKGFVAQCGVAVGKVFLVQNDADLENFPHGAIMLARHTSPRYAGIMHKARGIITDVGSATGHMSTLAREFRVPTIVNTEVATGLLRTGDEITLDATQNTVYRGHLSALDRFELIEEEVFEDSYEYRLLRRVLNHISPLNLLNPQSEDFVPAACQTFHDITRFIHETAVEELIHLSEKQEAQYLSAPKRLEADIPLGLMVIDAGGGTSCQPEARAVTPEQIISLPLRELLGGLIGLGMWCTDPVSVDLGSFMSSVTRTFSSSMASPKEVGRNLVVVLPDYMNINMRLGYHFTIIDAYISEEINDNYIYFRFLGGVTEFIRRSRRAVFIAKVLAHFDFRVEIHGDLVVGRLKKLSQPRMSERMRMLGGLVGYTRQLDARMHSDDDVTSHAEVFINAMKNVIGG
jgi:pyruvate, water dikinase